MSDRFIFVRSGMVVPLDAYTLALDLERRGVRLTVDGPDILFEGRGVTDDDMRLLRRWKAHVIMLLQYVADDSHLVTDRPVMPVSARRTA